MFWLSSNGLTNLNADKIRKILLKNCQYSLRELTCVLNISQGSVWETAVDVLGMGCVRKACSKGDDFLPIAASKIRFEVMVLRVINSFTFR